MPFLVLGAWSLVICFSGGLADLTCLVPYFTIFYGRLDAITTILHREPRRKDLQPLPFRLAGGLAWVSNCGTVF
jgi:hypothetical protein